MIEHTNNDQAKKRSATSVLSSLFPLLGLSLCAVLIATGCTSKSNQSKISLTLPDFAKAQNSVSSTIVTTHIRIQVTGSGIDTPITFAWDATDAVPTAPKSVQLEIPSGASRLIQVLAANQDSSNDDAPIAFVYGDATQTLSADGDVSISMAPLAAASSKNGTIAGRYLMADGSAPTGRVLVSLPIAGKPSIFLTRTEIFGGWFRFFSVENVPMNYTLEGTVEPLFSNVSVTSTGLLATDDTATSFNEASRTALISLPSYYSTRNSSSTTYTQQAGSSIVVGFFGPGAGTRAACFPSAGTNLFYTATTSDPATALNFTWAGNSASTGTQAGVTSGGALSSSTICSATTNQFLDHLSVNAAYLVNRDQFLGYSGPFQVLGTNNGSLVQLTNYTITSGIGAAVLSWQFLPNVIKDTLVPSGIEGITVFKREGVTTASGKQDYQIDDGYACGALEAKGFTKVQSTDIGPGSSAGNVTITGINASNYQAGKFQAVICPYRRVSGVITYFNAGADYRSNATSGVRYRVARADGSALNSQLNTECVPYKVRLVDGAGNQTVATSSLSLQLIPHNLIDASSQLTAYSDSNCGTALASSSTNNGTSIGSVTVATGTEASPMFYLKASLVSFFDMYVGDLSTFSEANVLNFRGTSTATSTGLLLNDFLTGLVVGQCYPLYFGFSSDSGWRYPAARAQDEQFSLSSPGGSHLYTNPSCTNPLAQPFTVSAGQTGLQLYYSPENVTSDYSFALSQLTSGVSAMSFVANVGGQVTSNITSYYSAYPQQTSLSIGSKYALGECKAVQIRALNEASATLSFATIKSISITAVNASLFSDAGCNTLTSSAQIPAYSYYGTVYMKANASATSIQISGGDTAGKLLPSTTFLLDAPTSFVLSRSDTSALSTLMSNNCYALKATPLSADGNVYAPSAPYVLNVAGTDNSTAVIYADAACTTPVASGAVNVPMPTGTPGPVTIYTTVSSTSSHVKFKMTSSRVSSLLLTSTSSEASYVDASKVLASYAGSSGTGIVTLKVFDSNGVAVTTLPDPIVIAVNLGGTFTLNGDGTTHSFDVGITATAGYSNFNIGGGTASSQLTATPSTAAKWKGTVTVPSNLLSY